MPRLGLSRSPGPSRSPPGAAAPACPGPAPEVAARPFRDVVTDAPRSPGPPGGAAGDPGRVSGPGGAALPLPSPCGPGRGPPRQPVLPPKRHGRAVPGLPGVRGAGGRCARGGKAVPSRARRPPGPRPGSSGAGRAVCPGTERSGTLRPGGGPGAEGERETRWPLAGSGKHRPWCSAGLKLGKEVWQGRSVCRLKCVTSGKGWWLALRVRKGTRDF